MGLFLKEAKHPEKGPMPREVLSQLPYQIVPLYSQAPIVSQSNNIPGLGCMNKLPLILIRSMNPCLVCPN